MQSLTDAIDMLARLAALQPTMERLSLVGSAYKRMALMADDVTLDAAQVEQAIARMVGFYEQAEALGRAGGLDFYYPAVNALVGRLAQGMHQIDAVLLAELRQALVSKTQDDPDFWSVVGLTELRMFEALASARLHEEQTAIGAEFAALRDRVSAAGMWDSVFKQMEFLRQYAMAGSPAGERAAADAILRVLQEFAGAGGA